MLTNPPRYACKQSQCACAITSQVHRLLVYTAALLQTKISGFNVRVPNSPDAEP